MVKFGYITKQGKLTTMEGEVVMANPRGKFAVKVPGKKLATGGVAPSMELGPLDVSRVTWGRDELVKAAQAFRANCEAKQAMKNSLGNAL